MDFDDYSYCGGTPFDSQRITTEMCVFNRRAYVLSEMGVGKTRAVLWAYDYLRQEGFVHKLVVVAPLSTLTCVWENEIFENFHHLKAVVLYGTREKRLRRLAQPADIYIINYDGIEILAQDLFQRTDIDALAVDELAAYRNSRSARWKCLAPIANRAVYAWGITGVPTPNSPTDAFGESKLLTPNLSGFSFKKFRDATMRQVSTFKWVERPTAVAEVQRIMQPAVRFTRDECFDLPPTTYSTREVQLSPEAAKHYTTMAKELTAQIRQKEITAANAGVKLSKLLQISLGFAYASEGVGVYCGGDARIKEICEVIQNASGKVIVLIPFTYLTELVGAVFKRLSVGNPKFSTAMVHGGTPQGARNVIFSDFQKTPTPRVLAAHPGVLSHGLTLTAANTVVWMGPPHSLETYLQANARVTRAGQGQNTHIIHISGSPVESYVYKRLQRKEALQDAILDMFEQQTETV